MVTSFSVVKHYQMYFLTLEGKAHYSLYRTVIYWISLDLILSQMHNERSERPHPHPSITHQRVVEIGPAR